MNKTCENCEVFHICPSHPVFFSMIREWIQEENILHTLPAEKRPEYVHNMIDEYVKYLDGHIEPQVVDYAHRVLAPQV